MADLPADGEGLAWMVNKDATKLLLISGLPPAFIAAAAAGDEQALACLRCTAQHYAEHPSACAVNALDRACQAATELDDADAYDSLIKRLEASEAPVAQVFETREQHTIEQLILAARTGEMAALRWMRAICPQTWPIREANLMANAAEAGQLSIMKYMHSQPDPVYWTQEIFEEASQHLDCLKWLLPADSPGVLGFGDDCTLVDIAHHHGLPGLKWFCANRRASR